MLLVLMTMAPVLSLRRQARLAVDHKAARKNKKPYYNSHKRKSIKVLIQLTRLVAEVGQSCSDGSQIVGRVL